MDMWEYAQEQRYTDVTVIEKLEHPPPNHNPRQYPAHRLVLSAKCEYFKTQFQSNFIDASTPEIHVYGNHQYPGVLGTILKALYAESSIAEEIYEDFVVDNAKNLDKCIAAFNVCGFLMLQKHMDYIQTNIEKIFTTDQMIEWITNKSDMYTPLFITLQIQKATREILYKTEQHDKNTLLLILESETVTTILKDALREELE